MDRENDCLRMMIAPLIASDVLSLTLSCFESLKASLSLYVVW